MDAWGTYDRRKVERVEEDRREMVGLGRGRGRVDVLSESEDGVRSKGMTVSRIWHESGAKPVYVHYLTYPIAREMQEPEVRLQPQ